MRTWAAARLPRAAAAVLAAGWAAVACADLHVPGLGPVASVRVSPDSLALRIGDSARIEVFPLDSAGTLQGQKVAAWTSSAPSVATVSAAGVVQGLAAGSTTITATVEGHSDQSVVLVSGPPAAIAVSAGNNQTGAVNAAVAVPPAVLVTDAGGNPVPLAAVTFAVTGGGGVTPAGSVLTNYRGVASAAWVLGPSAGANTLTATATDSNVAGSPVTFTATATVGPPDAAQSAIIANPTTIAPSNGVSFATVTVTVRDAAGSTVMGATVSLSATGTGNALTQPTAPTDNQGRASGAISSSVSETKVVSATVNGTVLLAQTASVTVTTAASAGLGVSTQPAGAVSNQVFATQPVVDIRDAFGNRVMTATDPVTVTLVGGNGVLAGGATTVNAVSGRATFSGLVIRGIRLTSDTLGAGPHVLQFSAPGFTSVRADTVQVGVSFAYNVQDVFGRNGCSGCHGNTHAFWTSAATLGSCAGAIRVIAGDTTNSAVYAKIKSITPPCGGVMPPSGLMSLIQIRLVRDWILQGAPNN